jgi:Flp pilus assembly pilin Flp
MLMLELILRHVVALRKDDRGADLVEYALIASFIAIAGVLVFPTIGAKLQAAFSNWGTAVYNEWEPADPAP